MPLLTRVSAPGEKPVYKSTVRPLPLDQLKGGVRKVPKLHVANNMSFLRLGKPQSPQYSMFLRRMFDLRQKRMTDLIEMWNERQQLAAAEDEWDELMEEIAEEQGILSDDIRVDAAEWQTAEWQTTELGNRDLIGPFQASVYEFGVRHLQLKLDAEAEDSAARTRAMLEIVDAETKLAEQEKLDRKKKRYEAWLERQRLENAEEEE